MPRLSNAVPKYRKHRATGQAVVTIAGKDNYLGPHGTKASQILYNRLIAEYLAAGRRSLSLEAEPAQEITVLELLATYSKHVQCYYLKDGKPTSELGLMKLVIRGLKAEFSRHTGQL